MNLNAKEYVPKQNTNNNNNVQFNLGANEYVPRKQIQNQNYQQNYYGYQNQNQNYQPNFYQNNQNQGNFNQGYKEDFEKLKISNEPKPKTNYKGNEDFGDESDEESWYPKYKDCECCKGFVYKCKGEACSHLKFCVCKIQEECDL
jgi:hypothetical protein